MSYTDLIVLAIGAMIAAGLAYKLYKRHQAAYERRMESATTDVQFLSKLIHKAENKERRKAGSAAGRRGRLRTKPHPGAGYAKRKAIR